ncbi:MAG TPA: peptidoglycan DD-metalloendopeptidase family protein, partial [Polyangiaceae bacterium]|nr:peptidoglycan DD-metalloendopeptidase family protein [Polyangiaceae bacterium]
PSDPSSRSPRMASQDVPRRDRDQNTHGLQEIDAEQLRASVIDGEKRDHGTLDSDLESAATIESVPNSKSSADTSSTPLDSPEIGDSHDQPNPGSPQKPVVHMGLVVDPDVADTDDVPLDQLSSEPPPIVRQRRRRSIPEQPSLRPHTAQALPSTSELLDPVAVPPPIPRQSPRVAAPTVLSPRMTAVFGVLFGLAGIVAVFAALNRVSPQSANASPRAKPEEVASATPRLTATRALDQLPDFEEDGPPIPGPWRVASLADDANLRTIKGVVGLEPFVTTLQAKGVSKAETYRILAAFKKHDAFKRLRKADQFTVVLDRSTGKVVGFELEISALEVYQAKPNEEGLLVGTRLDMKVGSRPRVAALRISEGDLASNLKRGRLRESVTAIIDRAFDGRASVASMPTGSTLRVILQEKTALGRFAEYEYVEALEYVSSKPDTKPLRLYRFKDGGRYGYFNQDGKEPYRGGWRMPCPGAPITSPFNPKRLHPVLKTIRPHQGTDFGAPTGTPIHATSFGTVDWVGPRGPAGNLVILKHPGNIDSYYMHMSRFAPGLKKGDKVETFQVIGFVGSTGRSTGPHLHFGIKKNDVWIDPMSLQLDGDRLVSASLRSDFEKVKAELDKRLDAIELPAELAPTSAPEPKVDPSEDPALPRENYDDDELEPGTVHDEPYDDPQ